LPHICLSLPQEFFLSSFLINLSHALPVSPICATFPVHLIFLDLITLTASDEVYKLQSTPLCSLLQPYIGHSKEDPNTLIPKSIFNNIFAHGQISYWFYYKISLNLSYLLQVLYLHATNKPIIQSLIAKHFSVMLSTTPMTVGVEGYN
jgi:hypothetical protein